jgi:hypothetical protein
MVEVSSRCEVYSISEVSVQFIILLLSYLIENLTLLANFSLHQIKIYL